MNTDVLSVTMWDIHGSQYVGGLKSLGNEGLSHAKRDIWSPYPTCPAVCLLEPGISSVMMLLGESSSLMYFPIFGFITFFTRLEPKMLPNSTISSCFFCEPSYWDSLLSSAPRWFVCFLKFLRRGDPIAARRCVSVHLADS